MNNMFGTSNELNTGSWNQKVVLIQIDLNAIRIIIWVSVKRLLVGISSKHYAINEQHITCTNLFMDFIPLVFFL